MSYYINPAEKFFPGAQWLWQRAGNRDERDRRLQFRRTFHLTEIPDRAPVTISADSRYTLWVNGIYVHHGPARGFQSHWPFDRIDIASFLRKGKNVVAVLGYQYGISHYSYIYAWCSGMIMAGRFGDVDLKTGSDWKLREAPGYIRAVARGSQQYGFQEFFDCRTGDDNWRELDYCDDDWLVPGEIRALGCMPWDSFEERNIPLLTRDVITPLSVTAVSCHTSAPDWRTNRNIGEIYGMENPCWQSADAPADNVSFEKSERAKVIDFGKEVVGQLHFEVQSDSDGEILDFMVTESLTGVSPDFPVCNGGPATLFGGRLILRCGANRHTLTLPWGFRYLVILRRGEGSVRVVSRVIQTVCSLEKNGSFQSSDKTLSDIWQISEHTQQCCMVDAYIDCPWRETAQWWGDALVQSQNTFRLSSDTRLFERGLRQIAEQLIPSGLTCGMAPTSGNFCILPDYSAMWAVTLYAHYQQTGSTAMWEELKESADSIFNYFENMKTECGLLPRDPRYWLFIDWSPDIFKNGIPTVLNLIVLWGLRSAEKLSALTGDRKRQEKYGRQARELTEAILAGLYDPETGFLYDGIDNDGRPVKNATPHNAALAILLDILPEKHELWLREILLKLVNGDRKDRFLPSSYFMYYIFEALKKKGYRQEVLDCIRRWWGDFVQAGLSTTPEIWLEKLRRGSGSMCHAWSAHPLVNLSELVLGVKRLTPGWSKIAFEPLAKPGEKASGTVPTPYGVISCSWDWTTSELKKNISVPDGIEVID